MGKKRRKETRYSWCHTRPGQPPSMGYADRATVKRMRAAMYARGVEPGEQFTVELCDRITVTDGAPGVGMSYPRRADDGLPF
jgi:hypothetical protein